MEVMAGGGEEVDMEVMAGGGEEVDGQGVVRKQQVVRPYLDLEDGETIDPGHKP